MLPSENDLKERYASYSNHRLLAIVQNKEQYTVQAMNIAKAELAGRNLSTQDVDMFFDEQALKQVATKTLTQVPMSIWEKSRFFFLWFAPWPGIGALRMNCSEESVRLKNQQSKVFALGGFISLILDGFVTVYFDLSTALSLAMLLTFFLIFQWLEKKYSI